MPNDRPHRARDYHAHAGIVWADAVLVGDDVGSDCGECVRKGVVSKVKDILHYYYLINVLVITRKDGRVIRDVMGSGWFKRWDDATYTSMLAANNAKYQNTAMVVCEAAIVDEYQDACEYCNDNGYPQPDLQGWFIVWISGDVRRDEIENKMRYC